METTRRKLLTLLSSIPALGALGFLGIAGKAEAKKVWHLGHKEGNQWVWKDVTQKYVQAPRWMDTDNYDFKRTSPIEGQLILLQYNKKKSRWIPIAG